MRKYYPVAVLLILLAAIALSASLVTTNANATPTWTCGSCHAMTATHSNANHTSLACTSCHLTNTSTPPTPAACAACHGGTTAILARTTHVTTGCTTTVGCHGVASAATITSFAPPSGPVGTVVTLTGTGFTGATAVAFNGTAATTYTVVNATQITATVPSGATTGTIAVTTPGGSATSATSFTVTVPVPAPTVTGFLPTSAPVGTVVTLTGTGFTGATAVAFNGTTTAIFRVVSATQITAEVPSGATTGTIAVTTPGGTGTSATSFTVEAVVVTPKVTLKLSGLTSGAMKLGRRVTAKGKVTPSSLAGSKVKLTVQKKRGARWVTVKSVARTISLTGAYSWKYKPARRGAYHMRATIAKTAAHAAAKTPWRSFKVK